MKNRNVLGLNFFTRLWTMPIFTIFVALFVCGAIAGSVAGQISAISDEYVIKSLASSIVEQSLKAPTFADGLRAAGGALAWQVLMIIIGLIKPVSLFMFTALVTRGFLIAFSASALFGALGAKGIIISLCSSGITAVITVPCLLTTAAACYFSAKQAPKNKRFGYFYVLKSQRGVILICTIISMWFSSLKLPFAYAVCHFIT